MYSSIRQFVNSSIRQFVNSSIRQFVNSSIRQFVNSSIRQYDILTKINYDNQLDNCLRLFPIKNWAGLLKTCLVFCFSFNIPACTKNHSLPTKNINQFFGWVADVHRVCQFIPNSKLYQSNQIYFLLNEQSRQATLNSLQWLIDTKTVPKDNPLFRFREIMNKIKNLIVKSII
jgi:hypothetical protein